MGNENVSLEKLENVFLELIHSFRKLSKNNDAGYTGDLGFSSIRDKPNIGLFFNFTTFLITDAELQNTYDLIIEESKVTFYTGITLHQVEQLVLTNVYQESIEIEKEETIKKKAKVKWIEEETPILMRSYNEQIGLYGK